MVATMTVTPQPLNSPPRNLIQVTAEPGTTVTVVRRNDDGTTYTVRTGNPGTLVSGTWTGYDYESPFGVGGTYTATSDTGSVVSQWSPALREFGVQTPWLIHPGIPALSMPINVARPGPMPVTDVNMGVFTVLGRTNPIVRTDGVRHAPTFTLTVTTSSWDEEDAFAKLISDASVLLLQIIYPNWDRSNYWWVGIGQVTPTRLVDYAGNTDVQWACACTVTSSPAGLLQSQWTYGLLAAQYATYSAADAAFATYEDMLIDYPMIAS